VFFCLSSDRRHLYFQEGVMPKKFFVRSIAIVVVVGMLIVTVPALKSAERKSAAQTGFLQILKQPLILLISLFPAGTIVQEVVKAPAGSTAPISRVRPTGDSPVYRPGTGD
jgi:hypothetical protein